MNDLDTIFYKAEKEVCEYFGLDIDEIVEKNNRKQPSMARGLLFYILHCKHNISMNKIARKYDRKDRGVKALVSKTKFLVEKQKQYKDFIK